jgi:Protein kinase domain
MPNANPPLKGSYWRNQGGGTNVPPEPSKQNREQTALVSPSQATATRTPSTNYRAPTSQGIFDQKTRREIAPVGAQFRSALVNKFFENQDDEQEPTTPVAPTKKFSPPTAPRSLINRIEPNVAGGQPTRQNSFLDAAPNEVFPVRQRMSSPVSNSSSMPMEVSPLDLPSAPSHSKERHVQNEPNIILMQSSDVDSFATQAHTASPEALQKQVPKNDQTTEVDKGEAYEFLGMVGAGSYGTVFKARDKTCGMLVALKKIKTESQRDGFPVTALREIKILQSLHHENVVLLREMVVRKGKS